MTPTSTIEWLRKWNFEFKMHNQITLNCIFVYWWKLMCICLIFCVADSYTLLNCSSVCDEAFRSCGSYTWDGSELEFLVGGRSAEAWQASGASWSVKVHPSMGNSIVTKLCTVFVRMYAKWLRWSFTELFCIYLTSVWYDVIRVRYGGNMLCALWG